MKNQLMITLSRLKNPSVVIGIVSQIIAMLTLLHVSTNISFVMAITVGVCSILVTIGIMSNPTTENVGFGDDILYCSNCKTEKEHVLVGDKFYCKQCGASLRTDKFDMTAA